jgi:hypothetical protein
MMEDIQVKSHLELWTEFLSFYWLCTKYILSQSMFDWVEAQALLTFPVEKSPKNVD